MKNKIIVIAFVLLILGAGSLFAQINLADLQKDIDAFSSEMAEVLPFNSAIGLNWNDAYIGNLPHFGAGIFGGLSAMDKTSVDNLLDHFDASLPSKLSVMPLPAAGAEARLGGLFSPFDIGFKIGWLPSVNFSDDAEFNSFLIGGDVRFAIIKGNIILPKLTLGIGYNYIKGNIASSMGSGTTTYEIAGQEISVKDPDINLLWSSHVLDAKLHLSKTFFFITPSVGIGASYSWSQAGYEVKAKTSFDNKDAINSALETAGLSSIDLNNKGFASIIKNSGWDIRFFGGLGFNLLIFKLDLSGMYDVGNNIWNAALGIRAQI
jgi:hypothetical protein